MTINHKFLISFCLLLVPLISLCQTLSGKVVRVSDGDTITILDTTKTQTRVRLYGIDCPEIGQDFGNVAKRFTSDLCFSKIVTVDVKDIDRYGRTVGIIWYRLFSQIHLLRTFSNSIILLSSVRLNFLPNKQPELIIFSKSSVTKIFGYVGPLFQSM